MNCFDTFLNACEQVKYLDSATKDGDVYTLIGNGKTLNIMERFQEGNREVLLWSKADPAKLYKVVGSSAGKILPRLVVQYFSGLANVRYKDDDGKTHIFEDVGIFPVSTHSGMTRFSDASGRKWICSSSNVPNVTLAFYKLLYDGRCDMSALMLPRLERRDDVQVLKSGVGGKSVKVWDLPKFDDIQLPEKIASSVEDLKRSVPNFEDFMLFPHQGDVPSVGVSILSGMAVSSADKGFIKSAERSVRGFIGSGMGTEFDVNLAANSVSAGINILVDNGLEDEFLDEILALRKIVDLLRGNAVRGEAAGEIVYQSVSRVLSAIENRNKKLLGSSIRHLQGFLGSSLKRPVKSGIKLALPPRKQADGTYVVYVEDANGVMTGIPADSEEEANNTYAMCSKVAEKMQGVKSGIETFDDMETPFPEDGQEVQSAGYPPGIEEIHDKYVNGHLGDDEASQMVLVICPECKDPMSFVSDWGNELNLNASAKLKNMVRSAKELKLRLYDSGAFDVDTGYARGNKALFSSMRGSCDAGVLLSIAARDGYTFNDLLQGVNLSQSYILPEVKKFIASSAKLEAVEKHPISREVATWVVSGKELDAELKKWGLGNPGQVFQSINVLGVDLDGKGSFKVPVKSDLDEGFSYLPYEIQRTIDAVRDSFLSGSLDSKCAVWQLGNCGVSKEDAFQAIQRWESIGSSAHPSRQGKVPVKSSIDLESEYPGANRVLRKLDDDRIGFEEIIDRLVALGIPADVAKGEVLARISPPGSFFHKPNLGKYSSDDDPYYDFHKSSAHPSRQGKVPVKSGSSLGFQKPTP